MKRRPRICVNEIICDEMACKHREPEKQTDITVKRASKVLVTSIIMDPSATMESRFVGVLPLQVVK